jgi:hypothetical protein
MRPALLRRQPYDRSGSRGAPHVSVDQATHGRFFRCGLGSPRKHGLGCQSRAPVRYILSSPNHVSLFIVGGVSVATLGGPAAPGGLVGAYDFAMPTQTVWGPVLGVGARVPLSPTLALRLEVEDYLSRPTDVGGEVSALVFSVGPSVTLGGRRTPASDAWGVTDH